MLFGMNRDLENKWKFQLRSFNEISFSNLMVISGFEEGILPLETVLLGNCRTLAHINRSSLGLPPILCAR